MARVKVKVDRGNGLQQVITVDTEATKGAQLGSSVFLPSGAVATPTTFLAWLGATPSGGTSSGGGTSLTSVLTTKGDLATRDTAVQRLPIGSTHDTLRVSAGGLPEWRAGATFLKVDDTNVTMTLGGGFATALLQSTALTLGWTGQLSSARGGTGFSTYAKGDLIYASATNTLAKLPIGTTDQVLKVDASGVPVWGPGGGAGGSAPETRLASFSGGSAPILLPVNRVPINIREDCEIAGVVVLTQGGTGSCVLDIWKTTYAGYPPVSSDSICGSSKPTISAGTKYEDATLTGWTTALSAGDTLLVELQSTSIFTLVSLFLILLPVGSTPADGYTDERARDVIAAMIQDGPGITWVYDDALDTLTPTVDLGTIPEFTTTDPGLVPAPGTAGTTKYLREDGTWNVPPGTGGGGTSGTYTPTLTNATNVASSTSAVCSYMRVGNAVTVSGVISIACTNSGAGQTSGIYISLPVASAFANTSDCGGTGHVWTNANQGAGIGADVTGDRAEMRWENTIGTGAQNYTFTFTYTVI